jgi:hypothetical protein
MDIESLNNEVPDQPKRRSSIRKFGIVAGCLAGLLATLGVTFMVVGATTGNHTLGSVSYDQIPPNHGDHSPVWQRCGFYSQPVGDEHAVHTLEHGVIWIAYDPALPQEQVELIRGLVETDDQILASPYKGLSANVVFSAWGRQLPLDAVETSSLDQALAEIRDGPEAPEPGAGCDGPNLGLSGGTGNPE